MGSPPPTNDWVVTPADRVRYDKIFATSDADKDGLVSGGEIKDVFLQSGIPQMCLAQIWALCDTNQSGKLTSEQFALAMWFVERKKSGIEPPSALAPNMVPPTLRTNAAPAPATASVLDNLIGDIPPIQPIEPQRPVYDNPELEMIAKEIEELAKERRQLENDVVQKEADIRIKNGEVRNLQSELDTLVATLKQLESQKGEAQKRLNDLKAQVCVLYCVAMFVQNIKINMYCLCRWCLTCMYHYRFLYFLFIIKNLFFCARLNVFDANRFVLIIRAKTFFHNDSCDLHQQLAQCARSEGKTSFY